MPVLFSVGYRYLPAPGKPAVNRMGPVAMFHFPLKGFLIADRTAPIAIGPVAASVGATAID
jgi:hypothetical protein